MNRTIILVAVVAIVGYFLFIKRKGCKCKGLKCTCPSKNGATNGAAPATAAAPANGATNSSYSGANVPSQGEGYAYLQAPKGGKTQGEGYAYEYAGGDLPGEPYQNQGESYAYLN